jgi:hypothetical protein
MERRLTIEIDPLVKTPSEKARTTLILALRSLVCSNPTHAPRSIQPTQSQGFGVGWGEFKKCILPLAASLALAFARTVY